MELKTKAAQNVAAVLAGGTPPYPVNKRLKDGRDERSTGRSR